jgi:2,3-bisphosphoglycerate-independent phosphoglycerate mutase
LPKSKKTPTILIILDGWGISARREGNAVALSKTPFLDKIQADFTSTQLQACCESVGLPPNIMGNSEVGHLNMGAGRIVTQDLKIINDAIASGTFFANPTLLAALNHVRQHNSKLHLVGMISDGLVHSDIRFLYALLKMCRQNNIEKVYIHAITDGIDVSRRSAKRYLKNLEEKIKEYGCGRIVTIGGRYYAMDRSHNYDRTARAYHAMVHGIGPFEKTAAAAIDRAYQYDLNDDMIEPTVISDSYKPHALVEAGDAFIFFNLRSDRTRQLSKPFVLPDFDFFDRGPQIQNLNFVGMTNFGDDLPMAIAYLENRLVNSLPENLGRNAKISQLYISEEEKFSHVAYFFHGGSSQQYAKEKRIMVPSQKVKSYAQLPEMSAAAVTQGILQELADNQPEFTLVNYANPDIVGHTGDLKAAIRALEFLDGQVQTVVKSVLQQQGTIFVTADHGNCEEMIDPKTKEILRKHTTNPVPFIVISDNPALKNIKLESGALGNIAPTVLKTMGLEIPREMTSPPLF